MSARLFAILMMFAMLAATGAAHARPLAISKTYETDKKLGVGLGLGIPSSVTAKYMLRPAFAFDLGVGFHFLYRDRNGPHIHGDFLWQPFVAVEGESFLAPFYTGVGFRFLNYDGISHLGARVPFGISFDFTGSSVEVFMETSFVYDFVISEGGSGAVDINGILGLRYYL